MKLLFLHGAIGAGDQMRLLANELSFGNVVYTPDFYGHGNRPAEGKSFSIPHFAEDILLYMRQNNIDKISIVGYSMGGYVALYLAKHHPEKIDKIVTLATKFNWDNEIAAKEVKMLDPDKIAQKLPHFAQSLSNRHTANDWKLVLAKTAEMMVMMGNKNPLTLSDYESIANKVLITIGDRDKMVRLDETLEVYKNLINAQLCVLPDTGHPIEQLDVKLAAEVIGRFLNA